MVTGCHLLPAVSAVGEGDGQAARATAVRREQAGGHHQDDPDEDARLQQLGLLESVLQRDGAVVD